MTKWSFFTGTGVGYVSMESGQLLCYYQFP
jgi:hypothetical protein